MRKQVFYFVFICLIQGMAFSLEVDSYKTDLNNVQFDVVRSFDALDPETGFTKKIEPPKIGDSGHSVKVRIVGQNSWAYRVKIETDGIEDDIEYMVAKNFLKNALNTSAAYNFIRLNQTVDTIGNPPTEPCHDTTSSAPQTSPRPKPRPVFVEEFFESKPDAINTNKQEWKVGCEVLANRNTFESEDIETSTKLGKCIQSIQNSITRQGTLTSRGEIFRNLYKYLRPEEQHFAAMIFTSQGEAGILVQDRNDSAEKHPEEMMMIMKVINNRVRNKHEDAERSNKKSDITALDIALDPLQFSMYNHDEDNWKQMMYPGRKQEFKTAIDAYMKYRTAEFKPRPDVDHVYHYHANWMLPTDGAWGKGFRANQSKLELNVEVSGEKLRQPDPKYDEDTSSGRAQIAKNWRRQRHIFYKPIDTKGKISEGTDDWYWSVKTPFKS